MDPSVAKYFADSVTPVDGNGRRFLFNDGSDIDHSIFGLKKGSFLAITAPVGPTVYSPVNSGQPPSTGSGAGGAGGNSRMNFGAASISGGIANRHPPQDSFLRKFQSVADATRDIELASGVQGISLNDVQSQSHTQSKPSQHTQRQANDRRTSFNHHEPLADVLSSPPGSLNENLNASRNSRHQSISEKIDNYNNNSPIQATAVMSSPPQTPAQVSHQPGNSSPHANHEQNYQKPGAHGQHGNGQNFWNPATATSFIPGNYFMDNGFYGRGNNNVPIGNPPPFMMPSPPPPQFMDPSIYEMMYPRPPPLQADAGKGEKLEGSDEKGEENGKSGNNTPGIAGIGLMNRGGPGFMFPQFNPYSMYNPNANNVNGLPESSSVNEQNGKFEADQGRNSPLPQQKSPNANHGGKKVKKNAANGKSATSVAGSGGSGPSNGGNGTSSSNGGGGGHIYRSPLLEEVRSNFKGKEYFLKDIYGHAIEFTKDQHGSRFIQQQLPSATDEEKEVIFNEIRDISFELMTDVFGNYVIQKYFEFGSKTQKKILLEYMIGHIYDLSLQMYGCRVVQRALEAIVLEDQIRIIEELRDYVLICAKDQNGNHVIQKSIERIPFEHITFILEALDNQIYHLSTHPYGCRVIQRLLEHSKEEDQTKILQELNRFIFYLIQDQYGNYVMQHILERGNPKDREEILKIVLGSVVVFSKHKFASNVIEKCIKFGSLQQRKRILHEVMIDNESLDGEVSDTSPLALMMKDQYANYVIQKLVEGFDAKSDEKKLLVLKLRQYLKQISSKNTYGKHLASVEKMIIVAETALTEP